MEHQTIKWLKISFVIYFLVILTIGVLLGYIIRSKQENKSPLISDLEIINNINDADFTCSCISANPNMITFSFDSEEISDFSFYVS